MNKKTKSILLVVGGFLALGMLSSCTASFCNNEDIARIMYTYDSGVVKFYDATDESKPENCVQYKDYEEIVYNASFDNDPYLTNYIETAISSNIYVPSLKYFIAFDLKATDYVLAYYNVKDNEEINFADLTDEQITNYAKFENLSASKLNEILWGNQDENIPGYGYIRYSIDPNDSDNFTTYTKINAALEKDTEKDYSMPGSDFISGYTSSLTTKTSSYRSCITTQDGYFGSYGNNTDTSIYMSSISWGEAFNKGLLEGLIVYPIALLTDAICLGLAGGPSGLSQGWPQILSIIFVTLIVRVLFLLVTLKPTLSQQKMQDIQPELAKLQAKYPNAKTNQYEQQMLAQKQAELYKRHHINPFGQIIVMIIQFIVFICVWGALNGSAALSTGSFLHLNLSSTVITSLTNVSSWPSNSTGWWTALVLFILMSGSQFVATKFPQWINKNKNKNANAPKLGVNPSQDQSNKNMKMFQYVMLVMIIVMGLMLPSAMGVYWIVGAWFSVGQTLLLRFINKKIKEKGNK